MNNKLLIHLAIIMLIIGVMLGYSLAIAMVKVDQLNNGDIMLTWLGQDFIHQAPTEQIKK